MNLCTSATCEGHGASVESRLRHRAAGAAYNELSACARTRLDLEMHGLVVVGSGGRGKRSRHREVCWASNSRAQAPGAPTLCALSYIPKKLEQWLRYILIEESLTIFCLAFPRPSSRNIETNFLLNTHSIHSRMSNTERPHPISCSGAVAVHC